MNAQFDSVTTASTTTPVSGTVPVLVDGCVLTNRFASPPDASTGVTAGTVAIVEGDDDSVKRHGFRYASNDGKYYPLTEAPNGEYTLASFNAGASSWSTVFYYNGFNSTTWTIVNEDRRDYANTSWVGVHDAPQPRGVYIEFQITGGANYRYGCSIQWQPSTGSHLPQADIKTLPADHGGGTVYYSTVSWRSIPDNLSGPVPVIHLLAQDAAGTSINITNLKVIIF